MVLGFLLAALPCLSSGNVVVCDDLTDGDTLATQVGGTLTAGGYRVNQEGNHLRYDLRGLVRSGAVRFDVKNLGPQTLTLDDSLVITLQRADTPPGVLDTTMALRIGGPPGYLMVLEAWDTVAEVKKFSGPLTWDSTHTYRFEIEFDADLLTLKLDGAKIYSFDTTFGGHQVDIGYAVVKLPTERIPVPVFGAVVGAVYPLFSFAGDSPGLPPPVLDAGVRDAGARDAGVARDAGHDAGFDAGVAIPDAGEEEDAGVPEEPEEDAGTPIVDAGVPHLQPPAPREDEDAQPGCACTGSGALWVAAALMLLLRARHARSHR
jgi:hypothetical protein